MATNPIQGILQMLMQQGGVGNMPAMQPGAQQAGIAPLSPQAQGQGMMPMPHMGDTAEEEAEVTGEAAGTEFYPPKMPAIPPGVPPDDDARMQTEQELADVRDQMSDEGMDTAEEDYEWQGDRVPTAMDLEHMREHPTDSTLMEFFQRFPDYMRELIMSEGGNPSQSPDQYAMPDEEWEELQADRSTQIDER